ncbi:uncharacterized protein V1513DRAFT_450458 [Lipomyces chichibuensis]|uniref:uncharacterized protein n=1 Tax=Lipomyces chichibuensis TaxID=1546026 RepID=UPI0033431CC7
MAPRKHKKPTRPHPRGQKPMVKAGPASDQTAANALSSHVRPRPTSGKSDGLTRKGRKSHIKTHGPLGNVRVDKRAQAHKKATSTKKEAAKTTKAKVEELRLNTAMKPAGIVHRRGKKGKVFADDKDTLTKVLSVVTARMDEIHATKIERAQQLEAIRDAKRKEIEKREQQKVDRLELKKKEIKHLKRKRQNDAGTKTGKGEAAAQDDDDGSEVARKSGKKRKVRFSV